MDVNLWINREAKEICEETFRELRSNSNVRCLTVRGAGTVIAVCLEARSADTCGPMWILDFSPGALSLFNQSLFGGGGQVANLQGNKIYIKDVRCNKMLQDVTSKENDLLN